MNEAPNDRGLPDILSRFARLLGRAFGVVSGLTTEPPRGTAARASPAPDADVRAAAGELGLPTDLELKELKTGIADAIPSSADERLASVLERFSGNREWPGRTQAIVAILQRLGRP
ncbi:MAG TPA: hypothetical protein VJN63_08850 [Thermoplasmata archaeon]|nr:hypothetical protein [Thermoplasmata archaeon]